MVLMPHCFCLLSCCRFLDATASAFVRLLRQYPLGRLVVFLYIIFVHVFIYILINRLHSYALHGEHAVDAITAHNE